MFLYMYNYYIHLCLVTYFCYPGPHLFPIELLHIPMLLNKLYAEQEGHWQHLLRADLKLIVQLVIVVPDP